MQKLWYKQPAGIWEEALPIGNGRMGAMISGNVDKDIVQVNEESIWDGRRRNRTNKAAKENLPKIRELLFAGKIAEAEELMKFSLSGTPKSMPSYQTLGELDFRFTYPNREEVTEYVRSLDLKEALTHVKYQKGNVTYEREVFASNPADCMLFRYTASEKGALNFTVNLSRVKNTYDGMTSVPNGLYLYGNLGRGSLEYAMMVRVRACDGEVEVIGEHIVIKNASFAELEFTADCSYHYKKEVREEAVASYTEEAMKKVDFFEEETKAQLDERIHQYCIQKMLYEEILNRFQKISGKSYEALKEEHINDYQDLFLRQSLTLGEDNFINIPTDKRLQAVKNGEKQDTGLVVLYLAYGRYLMISSSRPGNLPSNLQGVWNKELKPSWESKYTININTEMNYWLVEKGNLSECHLPLFDHMWKMLPNGKRVAQDMYGCDGFVAHHNTDLYGDCDIQDYWNPGSYWVMGAAWLSTHIWEHYLYTQDEEFLAGQYELLEECVKFFEGFLVEYKGNLVTCPSVSPENTFILPDGTKGANLYGVTMDNQILRDLCQNFVEASIVLGKEGKVVESARHILDKLIPTRISEGGYIMEWNEDYPEDDMGHRHISHLYGLHPSEQITVDGTPELAEAAKVTLHRRLANGGGHTGWSKAWIINYYAKLWDGNSAYKNFLELLAKSTYPNMFDAHPPFQIDGNFGAAAGILEMIVQSYKDRVVLLPALPDAWSEGSLKGIPVKGGAILDVSWENGELLDVTVKTAKNTTLKLCYKGKEIVAVCGEDGSAHFTKENFK